MNPRLVPEEHYRIGQSLQILREREILLVGCGRMDAGEPANRWSDWLNERIHLWDMESLFDYERRGPDSRASAKGAETAVAPDPSLVRSTIPSLLACMGAADSEQQGRRIYREQAIGCLHLNAWRFG